jgi:uncharacterized BrkB/YihY/UPF0761 family membrane protein
MKRADSPRTVFRSVSLFLRGAMPLLLVVLALLAGPALLIWWLSGAALGWQQVLLGGAISLGLLVALVLAFGWAVGRMGRTRR